MAGDLQFSVGLDATPLDAGVAQVEQRLEAAGVKFAEVPRKYANESAKAFEQVFAAEKKLDAFREEAALSRMSDEQRLTALRQQSVALQNQAQAIEGMNVEKAKILLELEQKKSAIFELDQKVQAKAAADQATVVAAEQKLAAYRQETSFRRLSDEEKLTVLRQQALSVLGRAQDIEGQSAEKSELLLQYEQKKTAIFELNQKVQAQSLEEQKAQTSEVDTQAKKYTGFGGTLELIKKGFKDIGVSIQGAGIGVFVASLISLGKQAINVAQEQRDLYRQIKQPLDANTASLARFGDGLDAVKKGAVSAVGFIVSGYTLIGETIGSAINAMRGIDEAQVKLAEDTEREAKYQEEKLKKLKQEQFDREKIRDLAKDNAEAQRKYAFDALNDEQQWSTLIAKNIALRQQLVSLEKSGHNDTVKYQQLQGQLIEQNTALRAKDLQLVKDTFDKQLQAINTVAPLAITQQEKVNVLKAQEKTLLTQLQQLEEKGAKTDEVRAAIQTNAVQQVQLQRDYTEKLAFDNDRVLEIVRLQYKEKTRGLTEVESAVLRVYKEQTKERENQAKIDELILVKRQRGLTPEEQKSLDILLKQEKTIEKQLGFSQANLDVAIKRKGEEDLTSTTLGKQVKALQDQGVSTEQIVATLIGRGAKEKDVLAILKEQEQVALRIESIQRRGQEYDEQSTVALEGVVARLKAQLDAANQRNANLPVSQRDPFAAALEAEYRNALNELTLRRSIGGFATKNGEDAARFKYGDTLTDRALRELQTEQTKTRVTIEQLLESFNRSVASIPKTAK